jgi:hypothetical protein
VATSQLQECSVESQAVKRILGSWYEMDASVRVRNLQFSRCEPLLLEACS